MRNRKAAALLQSRGPAVILGAVLGLGIGAAAGIGLANVAPPSEHKGLEVTTLGVIPAASMEAQIGLSSYKLQLREITIAPGGQIAKHSHEGRAGRVKVIDGTWTEGRPSGEADFASDAATGILEDRETVHWFWNRGDEPATALVCDIVPAS